MQLFASKTQTMLPESVMNVLFSSCVAGTIHNGKNQKAAFPILTNYHILLQFFTYFSVLTGLIFFFLLVLSFRLFWNILSSKINNFFFFYFASVCMILNFLLLDTRKHGRCTCWSNDVLCCQILHSIQRRQINKVFQVASEEKNQNNKIRECKFQATVPQSPIHLKGHVASRWLRTAIAKCPGALSCLC